MTKKNSDSKSGLFERLYQLAGNSKTLRGMLVRGALGGMLLKSSNKILGFIASIILARYLGAEGLGVFAYIIALISIVSLPATAGVPTLVTRETARLQVEDGWCEIRGLWRWGLFVISGFSLLVVLLALLVSLLVDERFSAMELQAFYISLMLIPLFALSGLRQGAVRGLRHVVLGQLTDFVVRPLVFLVLLLISVFIIDGNGLTPVNAILYQVIAAAVAFVIGTIILFRVTPVELRERPEPVYESKKWFRSIGPMALISAMRPVLLYTDILLIGFFLTAEDVGVYRVALSFSLLVAFGLLSINTAISPHLARLYKQGNMAHLQKMVTLGTRANLLLAVPVVAALVFFGDSLLRLTFGEEFVAAHTALAILALGQLVNTAMGSVGPVLNMTGHERDTARILLFGVLLNFAITLVLIPLWGINGAALATSATMIIRNLLLWQMVYQRIGIETMAFDVLRRRRY